jgi:adenylate kinase
VTEAAVVILLGPPGSGKGTQAARLSAELGLPHVSTGDLFRKNVGEGTPLGQEARRYMDAGQLVPDQVVTGMLFDRVQQEDCRSGFLLDGFPRTLPQARSLEEGMEGRWTSEAFLLDVPEDVLVERAAGRLTCQSCGNVHHRSFDPPRQEGICDRCGQRALHRRKDDEPEVVRERLAVYHRQTDPLIDFYEGLGRLERIDGHRSMDEVHDDLATRLGRAAG